MERMHGKVFYKVCNTDFETNTTMKLTLFHPGYLFEGTHLHIYKMVSKYLPGMFIEMCRYVHLCVCICVSIDLTGTPSSP